MATERSVRDILERAALLKRSRRARWRERAFFAEGVRALDRGRERGWETLAWIHARERPLSRWAAGILEEARGLARPDPASDTALARRRGSAGQPRRAASDLRRARSARGEQTLAEAPVTADVVLALGSETSGMSQAVHALCDAVVSIPMCGEATSLNVTSAVAILLHEIRRRRDARLERR